MKPNSQLEPEDLVYELADLEQLLDTVHDLLTSEGNYVRPDGSRDNALDRISSLINIAHSHTAALVAGTEHFDIPGTYVRMKGAV
ncbi:hypothetical protein FHX08_004795 [Rhizobium sp. BK529]|uniref:hypothetical protein n=1 Tax=Rhizobium sp. BK529 TaxID=2586983 RepID=UPI001613D2E3|nr:hypothetical protein [Rhizobium sp. BK529]MBB3594391.1 hypothetical protein [Rhizobium sp. BK529]